VAFAAASDATAELALADGKPGPTSAQIPLDGSDLPPAHTRARDDPRIQWPCAWTPNEAFSFAP
jgi:hypothetical protein